MTLFDKQGNIENDIKRNFLKNLREDKEKDIFKGFFLILRV